MIPGLYCLSEKNPLLRFSYVSGVAFLETSTSSKSAVQSSGDTSSVPCYTLLVLYMHEKQSAFIFQIQRKVTR